MCEGVGVCERERKMEDCSWVVGGGGGGMGRVRRLVR